MDIQGKRVLVTGGTGSLGRALVRRMLTGEFGQPERIIVFSRDEARQYAMRLQLLQLESATEDIIFRDAARRVTFRIGDIRDCDSVRAVLQGSDIVIHAAAMKQVPTCEYFPEEAYRTNVTGARNICHAISTLADPPEVVVGVSTDKAVKPVNVMGMTKALQERVLIRANLDCPDTRFIIVRYGNVVASRGSVVPLFLEQIRSEGPVTVTDERMTRFLISLDQAVDTIAHAVDSADRGAITVPVAPSARMTDLVRALAGDTDIQIIFTGIRPGEKLQEILISEEEAPRTTREDNYFTIRSLLPELGGTGESSSCLQGAYCSTDNVLSREALRQLVTPGGSLHYRWPGDGQDNGLL